MWHSSLLHAAMPLELTFGELEFTSLFWLADLMHSCIFNEWRHYLQGGLTQGEEWQASQELSQLKQDLQLLHLAVGDVGWIAHYAGNFALELLDRIEPLPKPQLQHRSASRIEHLYVPPQYTATPAWLTVLYLSTIGVFVHANM